MDISWLTEVMVYWILEGQNILLTGLWLQKDVVCY